MRTQPNGASSEILPIPLSKLRPSEHNVRMTVPDDPAQAEADAELVASIRAHGLLENLVVTQRSKTLYGVTAGARRFRALQALAEEGAIAKTHPVPCLVVDEDAATESSLAENVVRVAMHPADQVAAFAELSAKGATAEQIAARFGVSTRTVARRMRLGGLAPEILEAYRTGRINRDTAEAFAMTADTTFQRNVFESLVSRNALYAHAVRHAVAERNERSDSPVAVFVGLNAYREAGGRVEETLFDDHSHLLDPDILRRLFEEKLTAEAETYRADWAWLDIRDEFTWLDQQNYRVLEPEARAGFTTQEQETLNASEAAIEELSERLDDPTLSSEDRQALWTQVHTHQRNYSVTELARQDRDEYSPIAQRFAGVVLSVDQEGNLVVTRGLLKTEDAAEYDHSVALAADDGDPASPLAGGNGSASAPGAPPGNGAHPGNGADAANGATEADNGPDLSDVLRRDLRVMRSAAIRQVLARSPEIASDFLTFTLARMVRFNDSGERPYATPAMSLRKDYQPMYCSDELKASDVMRHHHPVPDVDLAWVTEPDGEAAFRAFRALPDEARQTVLAHTVAHLVIPYLDDDREAPGEHRQLVRDLDIDFPGELRAVGAAPFTRDLVFGRMTKALILAAGETVFGSEWRDRLAAAKKKDLAEAAERDFGSDPAREAATEAAAAAWLPAGFRIAADEPLEAPDRTQATPVAGNDAATDDEASRSAEEFVDRVRDNGHAAIVIDPNDPESIPAFLRS